MKGCPDEIEFQTEIISDNISLHLNESLGKFLREFSDLPFRAYRGNGKCNRRKRPVDCFFVVTVAVVFKGCSMRLTVLTVLPLRSSGSSFIRYLDDEERKRKG